MGANSHIEYIKIFERPSKNDLNANLEF